MKLELKHLIDAYKYQDDIYGASDFWKIVKISDTIITLYNGKDYNDVYFKHFHIDYSIVKRPLSDLGKEIEVNGEKFVPVEKLRELYFPTSEIENGGILIEELVFKDNEFKNYFQDLCYTGDNSWKSHKSIGYKTSIDIYEKLYEWHFDIHNGIGTWATDINTISAKE